ncbi:hypothetical protein A3860_05085 [Niastella vici]|uniref:Carrier domain-containing protein n=2 Tax=Niastella vici TaxID=1703345 RepID=A0A1V9FRV8_9BACT|nr:hypothetical protein A3860_05085 [Niastella vici]
MGSEWAFSDVWRNVAALSQYLSTLHLKSQRALLVYRDAGQFIIPFLACLHEGIVAVPVPFPRGTKQLSRMVGIFMDAEATAVMCCSGDFHLIGAILADKSENSRPEIIFTDGERATGNYAGLEQKDNETAFIQYTSGSTAEPKGVVIGQGQIMHNQQLITQAFGCDGDSVILSWLPFHHDMGLIGNILHAVYTGCCCVLMPPMSFIQRPLLWLENISRLGVTHSGGPNFAYDLCLEKISAEERDKLNLSRWRVAYNGSEPVRESTIRRFTDFFEPAGFEPGAFYPCYGLAEATLIVSGSKEHRAPGFLTIGQGREKEKIAFADKPAPLTRTVVSAGKILDGMEVKLLSDGGGTVSSDLEEGEICISGNSVSPGYWNKDNQSCYYFEGHRRFFRTGDQGFIYNNELFITGRIKEMLIIRGKNFFPYDIEYAIACCDPRIEGNGVAVFSIETDQLPVAVVEVKRTSVAGLDAAQLVGVINDEIVAVFGFSPYDIVLVPPRELPRTTSGKIRRTLCRELYEEKSFMQLGSWQQLMNSREEDNRHLLNMVMTRRDEESVRNYLLDLIGRKTEVSKDAFDGETELAALGIDSIGTIELVNRINTQLHINLDVADLFRARTLNGMVNLIEKVLWLKSAGQGNEITI